MSFSPDDFTAKKKSSSHSVARAAWEIENSSSSDLSSNNQSYSLAGSSSLSSYADVHYFDAWSNHASAATASSSKLGERMLRDDDGALVAAGSATASSGGSTGVIKGAANNLASVLVGAAGGLRFNLSWNASVANAPSGFQAAIIAAATLYTRMFTNNEVINIRVGYGEVNGSSLGAGTLGASASYGYLMNYATVNAALQKDASRSSYQKQADSTLTSTDPTKGKNFFVTTAQAKTLGLASATGTALDAYIGLSSAYPMDYATNQPGNTIKSNEYDAIAIAAHEISEVMGRIGSLGASGYYTPLDLFRYTSSGTRGLTQASGYFSIDGGKTNLGTYNNPANGGDATDWSINQYGDADGYGIAGRKQFISTADMLEGAVTGYTLSNAALAAINSRSNFV